MEFRKTLFILLCCFAFSGCSENTVSESDISGNSEENMPVIETAPVTSAAEPENTFVTEITKADPAERVAEEFKFQIKGGKCITVKYEGEIIDEIYVNCDISENCEPEIYDFNYDGFYDLYIPCGAEWRHYVQGEFWLWDTENNRFDKTLLFGIQKTDMYYKTEFTDDGIRISYDEEIQDYEFGYKNSNQGLTASKKQKCTALFRYENGQPVPVSLEKKYRVIKGNEVEDRCDIYEFDNEYYPVLKERQIFDSEYKECLRTEESPFYIRVNGTAVQNMKGNSIVQYVTEDADTKYDISKDDVMFNMMYSEAAVIENDFDLDGYTDIRVTVGNDEKGIADAYRYYRYDPQTGLYSEWGYLNENFSDGYLEAGSKCLTYHTCIFEDNSKTLLDTNYEWRDGILKPTYVAERQAWYDYDGHATEIRSDRYWIDDEGNKYVPSNLSPSTAIEHDGSWI